LEDRARDPIAMTHDQYAILGLLAVTVGAFLWGRFRHDVVALAALVTAVVAGLVPARSAFDGFGHPAVVTVAAVLVISAGLQRSGVIDLLARRLLPSDAGRGRALATLLILGAAISGFVNNVGAMALLMPLAVGIARRHDLAPGQVLMPLAFGTILGGMTTLIGTPPNLIVAGFREGPGGASFGMFDFLPVGGAVALAGLALVLLGGWRLVPARAVADVDSFETGTYLTEAQVTSRSDVVGLTVTEAEQRLEDADAQIVGMVRNHFRVAAPNPRRILRRGDVLVIEADPESLAEVLSTLGLRLQADVDAEREAEAEARREEAPDDDKEDDDEEDDDGSSGSEVTLREFVVLPNSALLGRSAADLDLRSRYALSLLAVSREGDRSIRRLRATRMRAGDVILLRGAPEALSGFSSDFGCVPLADRDLKMPDFSDASVAVVAMALAVAGAAFGLLPAAVCFVAAVVVYLMRGIVPAREVYTTIDWPVIVLLGAMIPIAEAMSSTGTADLLASGLIGIAAEAGPALPLALLLVLSMTLSDFMNNAATAAVLAPVALGAANQLGANPDSFLMAVAIGASCAFLTPIGHQNNTLILGPGGFRFGDYWRLGLPMEIVVVLVSVPMLLLVWPP
jgi:di/tricarboxylate transporter